MTLSIIHSQVSKSNMSINRMPIFSNTAYESRLRMYAFGENQVCHLLDKCNKFRLT